MRSCTLLVLLGVLVIPSPSQTSPAGISRLTQVSSGPASSEALPTTNKGESWTELSLTKSGLPPTTFNAVSLGRYEEPTYIRELVRVQWRPGDPIELTLVFPRGVLQPKTILYLYDYTADSSRFQNDGWCKRSTQGGFAAIGFASALSGQRFHSPRPMREWFVSELQEALATSTHDVQMILNYAAARGDLDVSRTGMIAQGSGGAVAVLAASVDQRIGVLDLLNPWGDWPEWMKGSAQIPSEERVRYLAPDFLGRVSLLDPVTYLLTVSSKRLRIQQIMDDPATPPAARDKIAGSVSSPSDQVVRYPNAAAHQAAWRNDGLSGWMRKQLTTPIPAAQTPTVTTY